MVDGNFYHALGNTVSLAINLYEDQGLARIKTFVKLKVNTYSQIPHDRVGQHIL